MANSENERSEIHQETREALNLLETGLALSAFNVLMEAAKEAGRRFIDDCGKASQDEALGDRTKLVGAVDLAINRLRQRGDELRAVATAERPKE